VAIEYESDQGMMRKSYAIEAYITTSAVFCPLIGSHRFDQNIRHEGVIHSQLDHLNICKLLGGDTSHPHFQATVFKLCSNTTLDGVGDSRWLTGWHSFLGQYMRDEKEFFVR
jgi:hypothetical protein